MGKKTLIDTVRIFFTCPSHPLRGAKSEAISEVMVYPKGITVDIIG